MALPIPPRIEPKKSNNKENFDITLDRLKDEFKKIQREAGYNRIVEIDQVRGYVTRYKDDGTIDYRRNSRLAWIVKKYVTNPLGMEDAVYYYITYKREWQKGWSTEKFANIPKYENQQGTMVNYEVIDKMLEDMPKPRKSDTPLPPRVHMSSLVVTMSQGREFDTQFNYAHVPLVLAFIDKYGSRFTSPWRSDMVGLPKEMFSTTDNWSALAAT